MNPTTITTSKKTVRARKTVPVSDQVLADTTLSSKIVKPLDDSFAKLIAQIVTVRDEYDLLQKQTAGVKEEWDKEQRSHGLKIQERDIQEEVEKRREQELYNYETALKKRQAEDEFLEKKAKWEKELQSQKDAIAKDREELEMLRKQVAEFEEEKEKAVKQACAVLQKELNETYTTEQRLREQEVKAEKELQALKIINLTSENTRLTDEIVMFKKSLEQATAQLKDVAVKVIESGNPIIKPSTMSE